MPPATGAIPAQKLGWAESLQTRLHGVPGPHAQSLSACASAFDAAADVLHPEKSDVRSELHVSVVAHFIVDESQLADWHWSFDVHAVPSASGSEHAPLMHAFELQQSALLLHFVPTAAHSCVPHLRSRPQIPLQQSASFAQVFASSVHAGSGASHVPLVPHVRLQHSASLLQLAPSSAPHVGTAHAPATHAPLQQSLLTLQATVKPTHVLVGLQTPAAEQELLQQSYDDLQVPLSATHAPFAAGPLSPELLLHP
jgi:hypothetical protein